MLRHALNELVATTGVFAGKSLGALKVYEYCRLSKAGRAMALVKAKWRGLTAEQIALQEVQMKPKKKIMLRLHETGFLHVGKINGGTPKTSTLNVFLTSLYSFVTAAITEYPKHTAHDRARKQFLDAEMYFQYERD